jgi:hypothetical protein
MDGENMQFLFASTFPKTATDGRYKLYQLPSLAGSWFIFYLEQWKCCFQRFMFTSHRTLRA